MESALANLPEALDALFQVTNRGEFITVQVLCFSTGPPPCAAPTTLEPGHGAGGPAARSPPSGPTALPGSDQGPLGGLPGLPPGTLPAGARHELAAP